MKALNSKVQAPPLGCELLEDGLCPVGHCVPSSSSGAAGMKPLGAHYNSLRTVEVDKCCVTDLKNLVHFLRGILIML